MGLMVVYVAPDPSVTDPCGPLPTDVKVLRTKTKGRPNPVPFKVPLTGLDGHGTRRDDRQAAGPVRGLRRRHDVMVDNFAFSRPQLSSRRGATVTWTFDGAVRHDVTLANGPVRLLVGPPLERPSFTPEARPQPGTYKLFCSLHPTQMNEQIVVRP